MSRYFFHLTDRHVVIDRDGLDLASVEDARVEACRRLCALLATDPSFWNGGEWHIAVTDAAGKTAFSISTQVRSYER